MAEAPPPAAPPPAEPQIPESHLEQSKAFFRQAMEDVKEKPQAISIEPETPPAPADAPVPPETPPKSVIPDDIIAPPKDEPKPDEVIAAIDAMELPKGASKTQIASFASLREKAKERIESQKTKIAELEGKIGESSNKADIDAWQAKITAAEEKASKIEDEFSRTAYEQSPRFRTKFTAREASAIDGARKVLEGTEISPEIIEVAARLTGQKRREVLKGAGIEGDLLAEVAPYLVSYDAVQSDKKAALENWKGEAAQIAEEHRVKSEAARARKTAEDNKVWETVSRKIDLLPLRKSKENGEWNARAEELDARAKQIFNGEGVPLDTFAETIRKGVAYDAQDEVLQKMIEENQNLRAENTKLKSARPGGTITVGGDGKPQQQQGKVNFEERAKSTFNEQLAAVGGR